MVDDLPLFSAVRETTPEPAAESPALKALKDLNPDDLTPREALEKLYPQTDLSVLEYDELRKMAKSVDGFYDQSVPDDDDLEAVINAWINIQFPEEPEKINSENID